MLLSLMVDVLLRVLSAWWCFLCGGAPCGLVVCVSVRFCAFTRRTLPFGSVAVICGVVGGESATGAVFLVVVLRCRSPVVLRCLCVLVVIVFVSVVIVVAAAGDGDGDGDGDGALSP